MEIKELKITDKKYPSILKEINDPPKLLYYRGSLDALSYQVAIAVVGTRKCSEYGLKATQSIVGGLAKAGIVIVSGMAKGIDSEAHKTALEHKAKTIAVLGSGIDDASIYPSSNKRLAYKIINSGGLILSEYESGTPAFRGNFPQRNRIIAGLTSGVLATEAALKSGTRITTRLALEYNRDVYAVPGSIFSKLSEGCNDLISRGAKCVKNSEDILQELDINYEVSKDNSIFNTKNLEEKEKLIFSLISNSSEAIHVDKIIQATKLNAGEVSEIISKLILEDYIIELGANKYICQA